MLEEARSICDYLIVGLQIDPSIDRPEKNSPIQSLEERLMQLIAVKHVNEVHTYVSEKELVQLLLRVKPDVRIIGEDHRGKKFTGRELPIEIYFNKRDHEYSTQELRRRIFLEESKSD